jgi:PAS domain S-box-containing protein
MDSIRPSLEYRNSVELLYELSSAVTRAETLEEVLNLAIDGILHALRTDRAAVLLFDESDVMRFRAWRQLSDSYRRAVEGHSPWKRDARDPQPICVEDIEADAELAVYLPLFRSEGIGSLAFIPLVYGGEVLGKFMLYFRSPRRLSAEETRLGAAIAAHVALAVGRLEREEALRESEARKGAMLEASLDSIILMDDKGIVIEWNPAAERTFGYTREEALGSPVADLIVPARLREDHWNGLARFLVTGQSSLLGRRTEMPARRADGSELLVELAVQPLQIGRRPIFTAYLRDVTEQRGSEEALRESEERFMAFFSRSPAPKFIKDEEGRYIFMNPAKAALFSSTVDECLGKTDLELLDGEDARQYRDNDLLVIRENAPTEFIEKRILGDGEERYYMSVRFPLAFRGKRCVGGISLDVTSQKRVDDALKQETKLKDEFLAMLAHELRNPLSPIRNAAQLMKLVPLADSRLVWIQEVLERQTGHLTRIVDDLLDVSRVIRGRIVLDKVPVNMASVIEHAVETNRPLIEEKGHVLTVDAAPGRVLGDFTRLTQVISNLINNAAKYTDHGGHIWVTVLREGADLHVRVRDTGMGISRHLLPFVFQLFTQDSRALDRSQGGLGIGLTVARNLVELHGGTIAAHSAGQGMGSEFSVRLPLLADDTCAPRAAEPRIISAPSKSRTILIVDDNADAAEMLARSLEQGGHRVRTVFGPRQALAAFEDLDPEVVLLDIGLPEMDGYEVARRLRSMQRGRSALLIAVTGYGQDDDRMRSREAGIDFHLTKPVELGALEELIVEETRKRAG